MSQLLKYDVIYILDPNSTPEEATAVSSKIEQIVVDAKGTLLKKDDWGKRRLAYLVQKHREGNYVFMHVSVSPETIAEITRNLRLMEKVIKFSIVKDTISHLKAKVKPPRVKTSTEGATSRPGGGRTTYQSHSSHSSQSHSTSSHSAPKSAEAPTNPSTPTVSVPPTTTPAQS